jgi:RNA polymerase sigma-70 factor (ECF subfamily)
MVADEMSDHASHAFVTTQWTRVVAARGGTPAARAALGELCAAYWMPVYRFLLREGRDEDAARELTQEFFARLLKGSGVAGADPARGKFRSYLLGAVRNFLGDVRDRENRGKRGGGATAESLDTVDAGDTASGLQVADPGAEPRDTRFDRNWALAILDRGLTALENELAAAGKRAQFDVLKPWLVGESGALTTAMAARALGLNDGAAKVAIHRLRKRFRALVRDEIARTVSDPGEVEAELQYFVEVLAAPA